MLAYLAFKALMGRYPDALFSEYKNTPWKVDPELRLPVLEAAKGTFEAGHGVYAATVEVARGYGYRFGGAVYLVAPLPNKHAVVGEKGWRAEVAVCLKPLTEENQAQIARTIVAAAAYNIPQVTTILRWAIAIASQAEGRLVCPPKVDLLDLWKNSEEMTCEEIAEEIEWWGSLLPYLDQAENKLTIARHLPPAIRISAKPSLVTLDHPCPL